MTDITHPTLTTTPNNRDLPTNSLSTFHANIHSLPSKYLLLIEHLNQYSNQPDLIVLSDNYLNIDTNPNCFPINGYYHKHIPDITVYYKTSIHISFLDVIETIEGPLFNPNMAPVRSESESVEKYLDQVYQQIDEKTANALKTHTLMQSSNR